MNKYYWLAAVVALVIGFQNCSNSTQFVSDESNILKTTGDLSPVAADPAADDSSENTDVADNDNNDLNVMPPAVEMPSGPDAPAAPPVSPTLPVASPAMPPSMPPVAEVPSAPPTPSAPPVMPVPVMSPAPIPEAAPVVTVPPVEHDEDDQEMEDPDHSYVCILQGPGKSVKVGIVSDILGGGSSAAASVCMSKRACLELMSQKFAVKTAEKRGYCPAKNPNAVNMSDAEIKAKLLGH